MLIRNHLHSSEPYASHAVAVANFCKNATKPTQVVGTGLLALVGFGLALPGFPDDRASVHLHGKAAVYLARIPSGIHATLFLTAAHGPRRLIATLQSGHSKPAILPRRAPHRRTPPATGDQNM